MTYTKELEALEPGDKVYVVNHGRAWSLGIYRLVEVAKRIQRSKRRPPNIKLMDGSEWTSNGDMTGNNLWSQVSLAPVNEETKRAARRSKLGLNVQRLASLLCENVSKLDLETLEEVEEALKQAVMVNKPPTS